ncbi:MAG: hypothetical protein GY862_25955 [Gammaproteobacteria bacterium]|nr:hypothetical protein [Gammaproteobacteria bacterium]
MKSYRKFIKWQAHIGVRFTGMLMLIACCALPAVQAQTCPIHALYDVPTSKLTIPFVDIPLLDPWTGNMTNEVAVFSVELELLAGIEDFSFLPSMAVFVGVADAPDACHAQYTYAKDEKYAAGGQLYIPFVDVPSIMVLPPNIHVPGPVRVFEATLRQLAVDSEVFHLSSYCKVGENCDDDPPCDCDDATPAPPCTDGSCDGPCNDNDIQIMAAIFTEVEVLYSAIYPMMVVDYWTSGKWPVPIYNPSPGTFTDHFVSGDYLTEVPPATSPAPVPFGYLEAIMRTQAELEAALAGLGYTLSNPACLADIAGKAIRFHFRDPDASKAWTVAIPNGVPLKYLDLFMPGLME